MAVLYDSGAVNVPGVGIAISSGTTTAAPFTLGSGATGSSVTFALLAQASASNSVNWAILADASGSPGAVIASGTTTPTNTPSGSNMPGILSIVYHAYQSSFSISPVTLSAGSYWLAIVDPADSGNLNGGYATLWAATTASGIVLSQLSSYIPGWRVCDDEGFTVAFQLLG